jgi:hypothetical protein
MRQKVKELLTEEKGNYEEILIEKGGKVLFCGTLDKLNYLIIFTSPLLDMEVWKWYYRTDEIVELFFGICFKTIMIEVR